MISSLALLLVFFRVMAWQACSERVKGDQVRSPHREVTIIATVLCTARLHTHLTLRKNRSPIQYAKRSAVRIKDLGVYVRV